MDDLNIALYCGASAKTVTLKRYLEMDNIQRAAVATNIEHVTFNLIIDGQERLAHQLSLGPIRCLVSQLEPAKQRLLANKTALIRSGVLDIPEGHYLYFEPSQNSDWTMISLITIDELPFSVWFPNGRWADLLYQNIEANRDLLIASTRQKHPEFPFELKISRSVLIDALTREAAVGKMFLSEL